LLSAGLAPMQLAAYNANATSESRERVEKDCKGIAAGERLRDLKAFSLIMTQKTQASDASRLRRLDNYRNALLFWGLGLRCRPLAFGLVNA
jgi:hypothetical protein